MFFENMSTSRNETNKKLSYDTRASNKQYMKLILNPKLSWVVGSIYHGYTLPFLYPKKKRVQTKYVKSKQLQYHPYKMQFFSKRKGKQITFALISSEHEANSVPVGSHFTQLTSPWKAKFLRLATKGRNKYYRFKKGAYISQPEQVFLKVKNLKATKWLIFATWSNSSTK